MGIKFGDEKNQHETVEYRQKKLLEYATCKCFTASRKKDWMLSYGNVFIGWWTKHLHDNVFLFKYLYLKFIDKCNVRMW